MEAQRADDAQCELVCYDEDGDGTDDVQGEVVFVSDLGLNPEDWRLPMTLIKSEPMDTDDDAGAHETNGFPLGNMNAYHHERCESRIQELENLLAAALSRNESQRKDLKERDRTNKDLERELMAARATINTQTGEAHKNRQRLLQKTKEAAADKIKFQKELRVARERIAFLEQRSKVAAAADGKGDGVVLHGEVALVAVKYPGKDELVKATKFKSLVNAEIMKYFMN